MTETIWGRVYEGKYAVDTNWDWKWEVTKKAMGHRPIHFTVSDQSQCLTLVPFSVPSQFLP